MCGIAGILSTHPLTEFEHHLCDLSRRLAHRGPDDRGYLQWNGTGPVHLGRQPIDLPDCRVGLVHRRLAVLDRSEAAWQPMSSPDGRLHLIFNGEIYNYIELREELQAAGHSFQSSGDTEVLLAALSHFGTAALPRLVGMFALALLDTRSRRLLLARDPFGIKPLYYHIRESEQLAFASESKAFADLPGFRYVAHPGRVLEYLRFGISDYGAETMLRDVHQVPAASYLEFSIDEPSLVREEIYWQPPAAGSSDLSFTEAAAELRRLFLRSVEWHLRSDVPVGAALSGGIDSSAIVMAMREIGGKSLDFSTFSYIAPGSSFNEQHHAEAVASAAGARIFKITATDEDLVNEMETLIDLQDEPFGSTSIYAQRRVFQTAAEEGITVMLDGQGTDEILAGYRHFFAARIASLLRSGKLLQAARLWRRTPSRTGYGATPAVWMHAAGLLLPPALRGPAMQISGQRSMPRWIDTAWFRERDADGVVPRQGSGRNTLIEQLQISLAETSLPALLRYEDRNSMASSVESRVPLLTTPLVEFVLSLPESYILSPEGVTKAVFRCALDGLVPNTILSRRDKIGFATPEADWLKSRQAWVAGILESDTAANIPAIRTEIMKKQWQDCLAGRSRFDFRFWRWINLILWAKIRNVHFE